MKNNKLLMPLLIVLALGMLAFSAPQLFEYVASSGYVKPIGDKTFYASGGLIVGNPYGLNTGVVLSGGYDIPPIDFGDSAFNFAWARNTTAAASTVLQYARTAGVIKTVLGNVTTAEHITDGAHCFPKKAAAASYNYTADGWTSTGDSAPTVSIVADSGVNVLKFLSSGAGVVARLSSVATITDGTVYRYGVWFKIPARTAGTSNRLFPFAVEDVENWEDDADAYDTIRVGIDESSSTTKFVVQYAVSGVVTTQILNGSGSNIDEPIDASWHFAEVYIAGGTTAYVYFDGRLATPAITLKDLTIWNNIKASIVMKTEDTDNEYFYIKTETQTDEGNYTPPTTSYDPDPDSWLVPQSYGTTAFLLDWQRNTDSAGSKVSYTRTGSEIRTVSGNTLTATVVDEWNFMNTAKYSSTGTYTQTADGWGEQGGTAGDGMRLTLEDVSGTRTLKVRYPAPTTSALANTMFGTTAIDTTKNIRLMFLIKWGAAPANEASNILIGFTDNGGDNFVRLGLRGNTSTTKIVSNSRAGTTTTNAATSVDIQTSTFDLYELYLTPAGAAYWYINGTQVATPTVDALNTWGTFYLVVQSGTAANSTTEINANIKCMILTEE